MLSVAKVAHCPDVGVKVHVYVPGVDVLKVAGFHVPVIGGTCVSLNGSEGGTEFWHNGPIAAKVGVARELIVMLRVAVVAHCPAVGVKVYTVVPGVAVLMLAGFQLPEMAGTLVEIIGNDGGTEFWHKGPIVAKVGVTRELTVMLRVAVVAHCPAVGVNVNTLVPGLVVFMVEGFQVPEMGGVLVELDGGIGGTSYWHKGPIGLKVGVT